MMSTMSYSLEKEHLSYVYDHVIVNAADPYSAARRWLASGQYTVVGHEAYAVCQATAAVLLLMMMLDAGLALPGINVNYFRV